MRLIGANARDGPILLGWTGHLGAGSVDVILWEMFASVGGTRPEPLTTVDTSVNMDSKDKDEE